MQSRHAHKFHVIDANENYEEKTKTFRHIFNIGKMLILNEGHSLRMQVDC